MVTWHDFVKSFGAVRLEGFRRWLENAVIGGSRSSLQIVSAGLNSNVCSRIADDVVCLKGNPIIDRVCHLCQLSAFEAWCPAFDKFLLLILFVRLQVLSDLGRRKNGQHLSIGTKAKGLFLNRLACGAA